MNTDPKSYILHLTVEEFLNLLRETFPVLNPETTPEPVEEQPKEDGPTFSGRIVYGIVGIERFFGVCHKTASDWKKDWLKPAIKQEGRKIMMDVEYALKLYGEKHPKETK